ncbi:unnamed protein product [Rhizoctonia solani]|uniref:Serine-threonine/tyrosine-protein kinase catalytic domain-containing protein n=1 Tax=Rhizoctonia solani TaxID=456999 RepID=A0A8H3HW28_9AGAM|nr:unnamed protein product [Rhizoctonia solani]
MEIITGSIPWGRMLDVTVMHNLTQNACPPRPEAYMPVGHKPSDRLWELTKKCWASEPRQRPHPTKVWDELEKINKQYQSNSLTLMNTHRIPDNDKTPTGPVSNSVPASGELLASSSTQNTRKKWFEKLSSVKFGHSTNPTQNALKPEKVETVNAKLQRIFKIFQRRRLQHERTRERSKIMSAKRELILLSEHDEPGGQGDITAPRSPPHSIQSFITAPSPPPSIQILSRCESPVSLPCAFDDSTDPNLIPDEPRSRSPISNASSISISPLRRMLIIGSSYRDHAQVKRTFSFETLDGTVEDRNQLKSCFKARNYSVETLFEEGFNRKRALARVAQFLEDAERGDVRAIVFTGCGYTDGDGMVSLVPPECSEKSGAITRSEWDQNIRNHSHPGVIVFSIMAHCFSGDMMKQDLDHQSWDAPSSVDSGTGDGPIFITFAASDKTAYESQVTRDLGFQLASSVDHFIYALIGAIHSIDAETGTWNQFFEAFEWHFQRARSCASWMDKPETPGWRLSNPQTPRFSASELIRLSAVF